MCSKDGRGIPDISAQALKFTIVFNNEKFAVGGTSCSAPVHLPFLPPSASFTWRAKLTANAQTVAGIISLLNDYRLYVGLRPFGFLNPYLYGIGLAGINDIEGGSNPGCGTIGFKAVTGWDPVRPTQLAVLILADFQLCRSQVSGRWTFYSNRT